MAQFHGHTHYDEFRIFYDNQNFSRAVGTAYISPSLTPWEDCNPSYRIYYVDPTTKVSRCHRVTVILNGI